MAKVSGTITLYQMIKDFQHITGRGDRDYGRLLNMAVMCLRDLNMFAVNRVSTYKINTADLGNDLGIIQYPDDAIRIYGVFLNHGGTLYPLVEREDMIYTTSKEVSGSVSVSVFDESIGEGVDINSETYYSFATRGAIAEYYYYDDTNQRRIVINGTGDVQLWIQYISSDIDGSKGEDTVLPVYYTEAVHNYMLWKESFMHIRGNPRNAQYYEQQYYKAKKKIRTFEAPSLQQYRDALYSTWRRTPKR